MNIKDIKIGDKVEASYRGKVVNSTVSGFYPDNDNDVRLAIGAGDTCFDYVKHDELVQTGDKIILNREYNVH